MNLNRNFSRSFTRNLLIFYQNFSSSFFKIAFQVSRRTIRGQSFLKLFLFLIDLQNWAKRFWILGSKFGRYCQCCIINSLRNFLMIMFFKEVPIFFAFSVFEWSFFWLSTVSFWQGCQNCTLHFWMKTLRYEKFSFRNIILLNFFYLDQIISQTFVEIVRPSFQNCFQSVEKGVLNFFSVFFSNIFGNLFGLFYDTCWKRKWFSKLL